MLVLRLKEPNFYLLDEPTNHLDIEGQEALEAELLKHETSCLLVSHDRSFVRNVGDRFWRSAASQNVPGSGLGLSIARTLLRTTGGEIVFANAAPSGLRVSIRVPRADQAGPALPFTEPAQVGAP